MDNRRSSIFRITLLCGMALLLAIVAVLQYEWASQLSAATEVRLGSNLQALMMSWHRDLYDELSSICITLQVGPDSGAHDAWNDYLQRYAEWNREGSNGGFVEGLYTNPDLVREIYEWQTSGPGEPDLLRLNPNTKTLEIFSIRTELQPLLARLRANSADLRAAMRAWELRDANDRERLMNDYQPNVSSPRSNALAGWQFDENIPALVHPVVHHANPFNSQTPVDRRAVDWLVVVLNASVIENSYPTWGSPMAASNSKLMLFRAINVQVFSPAPVRTTIFSFACSAAMWAATHRVPLPETSASEPSAFSRRARMWASLVGNNHSTPSAPTP